MNIPTSADLLARIESGQETGGTVPFSPGARPTTGDQVTFQEATFDAFGIPSFVPRGKAVTVVVTKVTKRGIHFHHELCELEWHLPARP